MERFERRIAKAPIARAIFGNGCLPRTNVSLWTYTALDATEWMSMTAGVLFGCPAAAYLRCLVLPLTTVGARDYIVSESRKWHLPQYRCLVLAAKQTWTAFSRTSACEPIWHGWPYLELLLRPAELSGSQRHTNSSAMIRQQSKRSRCLLARTYT